MWDLEKNFQDYDVLYTGVDVAQPYGIIFHKKGDERKLVSEEWLPVKNQYTLKNMIEWMNLQYQDPNATLSRILGPGGGFYGYIYTPYVGVTLKKIDENTLFVYDIKPPLKHEGGFQTED